MPNGAHNVGLMPLLVEGILHCLAVYRQRLVVCSPGLNAWNQAWGAQDKALAIDGKTMKNALDEEGHQSHILSAVGHESKRSYAQKK